MTTQGTSITDVSRFNRKEELDLKSAFEADTKTGADLTVAAE